MDDQENIMNKSPDPGIFITEGMQITVSNLSFSIGPDGALETTPIILQTGLDLCPYWLDISFEHLLCAERANDDLMVAKEAQNNEQIAKALQAEFTAGMQAIMASAVAMDAYYASVKDRIDLPKDLSRVWRQKGTARYKQIAEVLRRAFPMPQKNAKRLRDIIKQNMSFRDKAIHPSSGATAPALHAELNKVTDWRYATFRYNNAKVITGVTLSIIAQTARLKDKIKFDALRTYCNQLIQKIEPTVQNWEERYGKLFSSRA